MTPNQEQQSQQQKEGMESSKQQSSGTTSGEGEGGSPSGSPSTSQNSETQDGQGSGSEERTIEVGAAQGAIDFNHPLLRGKSPEEIEAIVEQQDRAIRSQNEELNNYHARLQAQNQSAARPSHQEEEEEEDPYGDSFIAPHMRKLEKRLSKQLDRAVAPLRENIQGQRAQTARQRLKEELPHFERLEPHIDQLVRDHGVVPENADENLLRTLYFTAVGIASSQGINLEESGSRGQQQRGAQPSQQPQGAQGQQGQPQQGNGQQQPTQPQQQGQQMGIPQHRPSSSPMPRQEGGENNLRPLTEEERKLARHYGMSDEEYLRGQQTPVDEVVTPGYSKDQW